MVQDVNLDIKSKDPILVENGKLWIWHLKFTDALSTNAMFSKFKLTRDARLFIYSPNKKQVLGAYTSVNNQEDGSLAIEIMAGSEMVIEYFETNQSKGSELVLGNISYGFKDAIGYIKDGLISIISSAACHVDINCNSNSVIQTIKRGTAKISYQKNGGSYVCSGGLMNNASQDGTPYFLTAFHCSNGSTPSTYVFYYNYEYTTCTSGITAPNYGTISGSTAIALFSGSDMALMKMNNYPYAQYNVHYLGYDANGGTPSNTIGIHHPGGDVKKVSIDNQAPTAGNVTIGGQTSAVWNTRFDSGTTEGGSSGSPLFDQNYRVIGQLYGVGWAYGSTYDPCNLQGNTQYYGRIQTSWSGGGSSANRLSDWLSPGQNVTVLNGSDCPTNSPACNYCSVALYPSTATGGCSDNDGLNSLTVNGTSLSSSSGCSANAYNYFNNNPALSLAKGSVVNFTATLSLPKIGCLETVT
jgi:lysyl endopeptidase